MPSSDTQKPRTSSRGRVPLLVAAVITSVIALAMLAVGGGLLYADAQKDPDGYVTTDHHRVGADTAALVSENFDVDLDGIEGVVDPGDLGSVRLAASPAADAPIFVGVARTSDVERYLSGTAHTVVSDIEEVAPDVSYRAAPGASRALAPPADQDIWVSSSVGRREQAVTWDVRDGDWSMVVMNADGSRGVTTDLEAGVKVPFLAETGWIAGGVGALLALMATGLVVLAVRPPRPGRGMSPGPAVPAAA